MPISDEQRAEVERDNKIKVFIKAIKDAGPNNYQAMMIFADWLEGEGDDPEWGEYVRVDAEMGRLALRKLEIKRTLSASKAFYTWPPVPHIGAIASGQISHRGGWENWPARSVREYGIVQSGYGHVPLTSGPVQSGSIRIGRPVGPIEGDLIQQRCANDTDPPDVSGHLTHHIDPRDFLSHDRNP